MKKFLCRMYILIAVTILLLLLIYQHFNSRARLIDSMFPGPVRIPILGKSPLKYINLTRLYEHVFETVQAYNFQPLRFWFFHKPYVAITDSKTAKIILSKLKYSDKMDAYDVLVPWLGRNHFLGSGEKWLQYRKFDAPLLNLPDEISGNLIQIFDRNCNILIEVLKKHGDEKKAFDLYECFTTYTLDNICEAVAGVQLKAQKMKAETSTKPPLLEALECLENQVFVRNLVPLMRVDWIFHLTPWGQKQRKSIKIFRDFSREVINKKREAMRRENKNSFDQHEVKEAQDLMCKHLLANTFTDEEIQIELESCILGGHDTITSTLSFIFYAMAEHPQLQEKVYREVQSIFGDTDNCPNVNQLNDMKYTLQFIKETLRYYTSVSVIGRYLKEDVHINEHQIIPKNTNVVIALGAIHKDPSVWPNPDVFDPERFSEENSKNMDPYAFVAFSAGPRNCLGYKLAMLEMKTTIAKLIRRFEFSLSENPKEHLRIWMNMVLSSTNGYNVKIRPRK